MEKIRPFSHLPGSEAILPKSFWRVAAYPSLLVLTGPEEKKIEIAWTLLERMENFTQFLDLKRAEIEVSGRLGTQFLRMFLRCEEESIRLFIKKAPKEGVGARITASFPHSPLHEGRIFSGQEIVFDAGCKNFSPQMLEYLSLGLHKKLDVDLIRRRGDLKEVLPLWFLLSQWIPPTRSSYEGMGRLLHLCEEKKRKKDLHGLEKDLLLLWDAGFSSLFVPHLLDEKHLGPFEGQKVSEKASAFVLLKEGAAIIRSLFLLQKKNEIHLLPSLPPSFVSGSLVQMRCPSYGLLDMEWRSYLPRRVFFTSSADGEIKLICPKEIREFRIRRSLREKGRRLAQGEPLKIEKGATYFFDRFEK